MMPPQPAPTLTFPPQPGKNNQSNLLINFQLFEKLSKEFQQIILNNYSDNEMSLQMISELATSYRENIDFINEVIVQGNTEYESQKAELKKLSDTFEIIAKKRELTDIQSDLIRLFKEKEGYEKRISGSDEYLEWLSIQIEMKNEIEISLEM
jgi:hypothetical protein